MGVPIAEDKSEGLTSVTTFLDFEIDAIKMLVRILDARCKELRGTLQHHQLQCKATFQQILSLIGKLNFFTRAIKSGRIFALFHHATLGVSELRYNNRINQYTKIYTCGIVF